MTDAPKKTHRMVKKPKISDKLLADFMAGSERRRRTIVQSAKYRKIARIVQHKEAKMAIIKFLREGGDIEDLLSKSEELRARLADDDFDRDLYDHNADYIDQFIKNFDASELPVCDILPVEASPSIELGGVEVSADIPVRMHRTTKTNKVRIGGVSLRYSKGKMADKNACEWHAAFIHGYLNKTWTGDDAHAENKLCLVLDAHTGVLHSAPTDAVSRFSNMAAGCASIADMWPQTKPPKGAVF